MRSHGDEIASVFGDGWPQVHWSVDLTDLDLNELWDIWIVETA